MYGSPGVPLVSGDIPSGAPLEQPQTLFRYGEQALWSTQFFTDGEEIANGEYRTFNVPMGQVGQGAVRVMSIAETNLKEGGRIPNGVSYDVFGLACQVMMQDAAADAGNQDVTINAVGDLYSAALNEASAEPLVNIVNSGALAWDFTQTQVDIAPIHLVGAGGGVFGAFAQDHDATGAHIYAGSLNNSAGSIWLYRKHPVALPGSCTFSVLIKFGSRAEAIAAGATTVGVRIVLFGYYKNIIEIG